jgi:UDP-2,3-diacylglucosamine hydrolase
MIKQHPYSLIISDLHLSESHPETALLFFQFLEEKASHADALYILGDFIEYWIGDDDLTPFNQSIIRALKTLTDNRVKLFFMHGNRDFMIGKRFASMTGATLLKDPTLADFYGKPVLLTHGDLLCTDDVKYLRYRRMMHWKWLQFLLLRLPLRRRRKIALSLRQASARHYQQRQASGQGSVDVTAEGIAQAFTLLNCHTLIHGHTHRMAIHYYPEQHKRIVLGDWHSQGSYVQISPAEIILKSFYV